MQSVLRLVPCALYLTFMSTTTSTQAPFTVHRSMIVMDVISMCPAAADIMAEYGLHCFSCEVGGSETLEEGCKIHGFDEETIDALVVDINDTIEALPTRPQEITITTPAAENLLKIAKQEGKKKMLLAVVPDGTGGFCLEFCEKKPKDDAEFTNKDVPDVSCFATPAVLFRIGGAVIDFRDERFKLDLPEDNQEGCCKGDDVYGNCGCK